MTLRQLINLTRLLNSKSPRSVTSLQVLETIDRDSTCSRGKLQQSRLLFRIPRSHTFPEIHNHLVRLRVSAVIGVFLPVINIDIGDTTNEEFELSFVEDGNKVCGNEVMESSNEVSKLFFDTFFNAPFRYESFSRLVFVFLINIGKGTYSTYSCLFSFVTSISFPPGLSSMVTVSPKRLSSVVNVKSRTSVISFSLLVCQYSLLTQHGFHKLTASMSNSCGSLHQHLPYHPKQPSSSRSSCRTLR